MTEITHKLCPYCGIVIELVEQFCATCALTAPWEDSNSLQLCPYCEKESIGKFAICCEDCLRSGRVHKLEEGRVNKIRKKLAKKPALNRLGSLFVYFCIFFITSLMLMALLWMGSCTLKAIQG